LKRGEEIRDHADRERRALQPDTRLLQGAYIAAKSIASLLYVAEIDGADWNAVATLLYHL
jgi:hypothetical protein